eukprot:m.218849 g.218849  ORF g.218849 m.218849 type:complete len:120 (+) comp39911_c0_seq1:1733-2092(+)
MNVSVGQAAQRGRWDTVKDLVSQGANVDERDGLDRALFYAAKEGHLDTCKWLVDRGAGVRSSFLCSETVLHVACTKSVCDYLISCGADVLATDEDGKHPLHFARTAGVCVNLCCLMKPR